MQKLTGPAMHGNYNTAEVAPSLESTVLLAYILGLHASGVC